MGPLNLCCTNPLANASSGTCSTTFTTRRCTCSCCSSPFLSDSTSKGQWSLRVVKDHTDCVTATRPQTADAVSKVHAVDTPGSLDGTVANGEHHTVTTTKRHDLGSGLHPWPLLGQHKLTAGEVCVWFREKNRHLQRKHMLAVDVLMQRVEVALAILQQKRGRPRLPRLVAPGDEVCVRVGVAFMESQRYAPPVGDRRQVRVERRAEGSDLIGQRIREVFVFTASEAMPCHDDVAAKQTVVRVEPGYRRALARREEFRQERPTVGIQVLCDQRPVVVTDSVIRLLQR